MVLNIGCIVSEEVICKSTDFPEYCRNGKSMRILEIVFSHGNFSATQQNHYPERSALLHLKINI